MKQISATILLLFITSGIYSQHTFKGKVISICKGHIEEPVGFVKVYLDSKTFIYTDGNGGFEFQNISGSHAISIHTGSHTQFDSKIEVNENIENALIVLEYGIDCDFDNLISQKKRPKFKDFLILENTYMLKNEEINKSKKFTISQADTSRLTEKTNSIKDDAYLHPIDCITPYTLKKGEWIYAQSIQTLPFPSWAFVGITDKLTAQIDLLPWIFGAFSELKKPIPSINFRYRFNTQKGLVPTIGVEAMFVHFWDTLQRFETPSLTMWENGSYFHFKPSLGYRIKDKLDINLSAGVDYIGELIMQKNDSLNFQTKTFTNSWNPNFSIGIDYRPSNWISYHIGYTYGSTFTYLENIPRKRQFNYGFRIAPFYKNRFGFLRSMRIELVAINGYFSDIDAKQSFPIPVFPFFYWQWKKKEKKTTANKT